MQTWDNGKNPNFRPNFGPPPPHPPPPKKTWEDSKNPSFVPILIRLVQIWAKKFLFASFALTSS